MLHLERDPGAREHAVTDCRPAQRGNEKALANPSVFKRLQEIGIDPTPGSTPEQVAEFTKAELAKWTPIIKASGAEVN
jgi:tripartite-type tricarboxylate transporter receptor subunit TctC